MIPPIRKEYNSLFTEEQYVAFLKKMDERYPGAIEFRVAETPVFVPADFMRKMNDACEFIIDQMLRPGFMELTARAVPEEAWTHGETPHCHCLAFDFGICDTGSGIPEPRLVEMQGFPSLYGFQVMYPEVLKENMWIPDGFSQYLNGLDKESYLQLLKDTIVAGEDPEQVILLEIKPEQQKTRIDFYCTRDYLGIEPVCITSVFSRGKDLFYRKGDRVIPIRRIYNRVINDELRVQQDLPTDMVDFRKEWNVQWVSHPNWFFRLSKFTLPLINHPAVPPTFYLDSLQDIPKDLENYVLKPLFSFAGQGVIIDVTPEDIQSIKDPGNWILQQKVDYANIIDTPSGPAKAEIRLMYLWKEGSLRPEPAINLARLSKGKMIGTRYNKDKTWVGGSVAFIERL